MPECQKIKNGGLDQYGTEHFEMTLTYDKTQTTLRKKKILHRQSVQSVHTGLTHPF